MVQYAIDRREEEGKGGEEGEKGRKEEGGEGNKKETVTNSGEPLLLKRCRCICWIGER